MNGYKIALLVMYAISSLVSVATVGRPRQPTSPGQAALVLVFTGVMAWLVVLA